jgi:hypothetical protein
MNSILDQLNEYGEVKKVAALDFAIVAGYIRVWYDVDREARYELTEKGVKKLAEAMV